MKPEKYARVVFKSAPLGHVLKKLREHYVAQKNNEWLVVPYVLSSAAYLEARINDALFHFALMKYGEEIAATFIALPLPKKLESVVPILTEGRYSINKQYFVYERLQQLIRTRNALAHSKSEFEEMIGSEKEMRPVFLVEGGVTKLPQEFVRSSKGTDLTLGASEKFTPLEYHDALEKLDKWFFGRCPDRLAKVQIVVANTKAGWKEGPATYVKFLD